MGGYPGRDLRGSRRLIALDTNLLIYAHRADADWHLEAARRVRELADGPGAWGLPWSCLHEFVGVVTHPRVFSPPSPVEKALETIDALLESPTLVLLHETPGYWPILRRLVGDGRAIGPRVHDARVAAVCLANGVSELWTSDRDFGRFPELRTRNPLVP